MEQTEFVQTGEKPSAYVFVGPDGPHFVGVGKAAKWLGCSPMTLRSTVESAIAWPENMVGSAPDSLLMRAAREFPRLFRPYRAEEEAE